MCYCHTAIWWKDKICPLDAETQPWEVCPVGKVGLEIVKMKTNGGDNGAKGVMQIQTGNSIQACAFRPF